MESASMQRATVFSFGRVIDDPWSFLVIANLFTALKGNNFIFVLQHAYANHFPLCLGINLVRWLQGRGVLKAQQNCPKCLTPMKLHQGTNYADGCRWVCKHVDPKHKKRGKCPVEIGVRVGSFFNKRLSLAEMVCLFPYFIILADE